MTTQTDLELTESTITPFSRDGLSAGTKVDDREWTNLNGQNAHAITGNRTVVRWWCNVRLMLVALTYTCYSSKPALMSAVYSKSVHKHTMQRKGHKMREKSPILRHRKSLNPGWIRMSNERMVKQVVFFIIHGKNRRERRRWLHDITEWCNDCMQPMGPFFMTQPDPTHCKLKKKLYPAQQSLWSYRVSVNKYYNI